MTTIKVINDNLIKIRAVADMPPPKSKKVFYRSDKHNIKLNVSKCIFGITLAKFIGLVITTK